jgi:hypothetical protein
MRLRPSAPASQAEPPVGAWVNRPYLNLVDSQTNPVLEKICGKFLVNATKHALVVATQARPVSCPLRSLRRALGEISTAPCDAITE